jgi:DNA-directed RNA polymerase specialized sigma subunit
MRGLDAERELKDLEAKASVAKVEIESAIVKLDDDKLQFLLVYRYINWLTWEEIQDKLFISQTTRKRWHDKALDLLQVGP